MAQLASHPARQHNLDGRQLSVEPAQVERIAERTKALESLLVARLSGVPSTLGRWLGVAMHRELEKDLSGGFPVSTAHPGARPGCNGRDDTVRRDGVPLVHPEAAALVEGDHDAPVGMKGDRDTGR